MSSRRRMLGLDRHLGEGEAPGKAWLTARALVASVSLHEDGSRGSSSSTHSYDLGLRVQFDDGTTAFVSRRVGGAAATDLRFCAGDIVLVLYDPADRSHVEVDEDAWRVQQRAHADSAS
jgi:hypothetical protein